MTTKKTHVSLASQHPDWVRAAATQKLGEACTTWGTPLQLVAARCPCCRTVGRDPTPAGLVEDKDVSEHIAHVRDAGRVPVADGLIGGAHLAERALQLGDAGRVPIAEGWLKTLAPRSLS